MKNSISCMKALCIYKYVQAGIPYLACQTLRVDSIFKNNAEKADYTYKQNYFLLYLSFVLKCKNLIAFYTKKNCKKPR